MRNFLQILSILVTFILSTQSVFSQSVDSLNANIKTREKIVSRYDGEITKFMSSGRPADFVTGILNINRNSALKAFSGKTMDKPEDLRSLSHALSKEYTQIFADQVSDYKTKLQLTPPTSNKLVKNEIKTFITDRAKMLEFLTLNTKADKIKNAISTVAQGILGGFLAGFVIAFLMTMVCTILFAAETFSWLTFGAVVTVATVVSVSNAMAVIRSGPLREEAQFFANRVEAQVSSLQQYMNSNANVSGTRIP